MSKPYGHVFLPKGSGAEYGDMKCIKCGKKINGELYDYVAWRETKGYDWSYKTSHRECYHDDRGWVKIDKALHKSRNIVLSVKNSLNRYRSADGEFKGEVYQALYELGLIDN